MVIISDCADSGIVASGSATTAIANRLSLDVLIRPIMMARLPRLSTLSGRRRRDLRTGRFASPRKRIPDRKAPSAGRPESGWPGRSIGRSIEAQGVADDDQ